MHYSLLQYFDLNTVAYDMILQLRTLAYLLNFSERITILKSWIKSSIDILQVMATQCVTDCYLQYNQITRRINSDCECMQPILSI